MKTVQVAAKGIIKYRGKFLLIKEVINGKDCWDLPGGKIKFKESPVDALKREIKEEVGLTITDEKLAGIYWFYKYRGGGQVICITYMCKPYHTKVDITKNPAEKEDIQSYQWVSKEEFVGNDFGVNKSLHKLIKEVF